MKKIKIISCLLTIAIVLSVAFIGAESIRLSSPENKGEKPVIAIDEVYNEDSIKYIGLGYSVTYLLESGTNSEGDTITTRYIYSAEVRLFDKILVGAWIE